MLHQAFNEVYTKFKLHFYQEIFRRFQNREASLTTVETFCMESIMALGRPTVNEFATFMCISPPNAAYKVNSLVKKGYVDRFRSKEDRRVVYVRLLEKGENAYHHHEDYHKQMTQAIVDKLDESEIPVLLKTLDALTGFFTDYTRESKEKSSDSMDKE